MGLFQYYDGRLVEITRGSCEYVAAIDYDHYRPFWFVCETEHDDESKYINDSNDINRGFLPSEAGSEWIDERPEEPEKPKDSRRKRMELVLKGMKGRGRA